MDTEVSEANGENIEWTVPVIRKSIFGSSFRNPFPEWNMKMPSVDSSVTVAYTAESLERTFPVLTPNNDLINSSQNIACWFGHATVFVKINGITVLTDPLFHKRCGPLNLGFRRMCRFPYDDLNDIPKIDIIVISHDHYDHLDTASCKFIIERDHPTLYVPKGVRSFFHSMGVPKNKVFELSWWDSLIYTPNEELPDDDIPFTYTSNHSPPHLTHSQLRLTFVPSMHWGTRSLFDAYTRLWGGWVVESREKKAYFGGDTGFCNVFKETARLGPFDIVFFPIGAYFRSGDENRLGMHINPKDALTVYSWLGNPLTIAIHWGTYELAEGAMTAQAELERNKAVLGESTDRFITVNLGKLTIF